ncbi:ABC transporter ATP-binding protein [Pontibacter oryzae]|uniref:ABC transporter ATP-binding protein n=1 Tax=Pontibacter oryzae TaxID=2304593 RepID=A0A399S762_9BACT|nr:ABC transporter ATP-binding protein [Pontibacter oryzae]RIJ37647.1 ABC transporter ATP-binding protein [Pontibacter oryzae]
MKTLLPILQVSGLETSFRSRYNSIKAVDGISFELYPGETIAIVGESGSGKSVTALSLMGLLGNGGVISEGKVLYQSKAFGEVDLLQLPEKQLQRLRGQELSMVFQEPMSSLNPVLTCGKQVAEVLSTHTSMSDKDIKKRVIELFELVELPRAKKMYDAYPHEISGGQAQRIMIAMAMACTPRILIADEPTTALDVTVQARVLQLLDKLRAKEGMTVLFITHDLAVAAEIADRILVMYQGRIVEQGSTMQIFTNPRHNYTKALLASRPKLRTAPKTLPTSTPGFLENREACVQPKDYKPKENYKSRPEPLPPLLQVDALKVYFPLKKGIFGRSREQVKAVDGISFSVLPGETLSLVGESGSGKTTLGRAILRLVKPTSGRVLYDGQDIASMRDGTLRKSRKNFQMIFQDPYSSLNPMQSVGDAIIEPMRVHNLYGSAAARRAEALQLLDKVGLPKDSLASYPHEFSGGQRQRICIARALASKPKYLICDEAVSSLDVSVQAQVLQLLNQLKQELQLAIIFITHDLSVAQQISDRILVMYQGRVVEQGTPDELFFNPQQPYTRTLINAIPKGEPEDIAMAQQKRQLRRTSSV